MDIPVQLDPAFASSDAEIAILNAVYDYLIDVDENNRLQPRLAQSAQISADGLSYTFELHPDAMFHDGSPVTAADVIFTFDRLRDPEAGLPTSDLYSNIADIFAPGDADPAQSKTVIFQLTEPDPFFQYNLSDNHAVVVKAGTEDFTTAFNGSGPFKVVSYSPENRMELAANVDYFLEGKPGVATLDFIFFSDQAASVDALRGGQVDLALRLPTPLYLALQGEPGIQTKSVATNGFDLVRLRADQEPGNKPEVIEAFKLATDRQAIFDQVALSLGAVGRDSPIGPLFTDYYSEETPIPARDPAKARELLTQAGYPDGLTLDLHVPDSGDRPDLAAVLKEQWAEAGITVNILVEPESVYYGDNGWLEVPLGITGWGSRPIPQFYLDVMLVCDAIWNESRFCDEEFDALAAIAGTTLDENERAAAYGEIQRILIERGPIIVPYFFAQLGAIRDGFDGFALKAFAGRTDLAAIRAAR
jgi:peptide/nickel transport system substrate-binding protein